MLHFGKTFLPLFLYFNEFGVNNPLGSHAASVYAAYYSIPILPDYYLSTLQNIFLAGIIKSSDMKKFGNKSSLHPLIEQLIKLETDGIVIRINGKQIRVYFNLCLILGDNLGINEILSFTKSFNCKPYCRICTQDIENMKKMNAEDLRSLRTVKSYNEALLIENEKERVQKTGIKENSIFNNIPSFHVTQNFTVDVMHDLLEGICHYDIGKILSKFIFELKMFSLSTLNSRKQMFPYGDIEIGYRGNEIKLSDLQKLHFRMTSREMLTFTTLLPLMIHDLVPTTNKIWSFLLCLIDIIDILFLEEITEMDLVVLKSLIRSHNQQYQLLFSDSLKQKFHLLTHYPTVIQKSGPVKKLWSMRFEAKHKTFKDIAFNTTSRKNLALTLSIKSS